MFSDGYHMCDNFAASYVNSTKTHVGAAAELAVLRKHSEYNEMEAKGYTMVLFVETTSMLWILGAESRFITLGGSLQKKQVKEDRRPTWYQGSVWQYKREMLPVFFFILAKRSEAGRYFAI